MNPCLCVLGLGNPLRCDDGIGITLLSAIQKHMKGRSSIDFVDGGTAGFSLTHILSQYQTVLVLDAVNFGGIPGELRVFQENDVATVQTSCWHSSHGITIWDAVKTARILGDNPKKIIFIGVQPKKLSYEEGLSDELTQQLPSICDVVLETINDLLQKQNG